MAGLAGCATAIRAVAQTAMRAVTLARMAAARVALNLVREGNVAWRDVQEGGGATVGSRERVSDL